MKMQRNSTLSPWRCLLVCVFGAVMAQAAIARQSNQSDAMTVEDALIQDAQSQYEMGLRFAQKAGGNYQPLKAEKWLKRAAEQRHMEAQYELAMLYGTGDISVDADYILPLTFKWMKAAAEQGHVEAQFKTGDYFQVGTGTTKDISKAFYWYEQAGAAGHRGALSEMARAFYWGRELGGPVDKNHKLALFWFDKLAAAGDPNAYFWIGTLYAGDTIGAADDALAARYFAEGARLEDASSQSSLATRYMRGDGVPLNLDLALVWFEKAYVNGDSGAAHWIGVIKSQQRPAPASQTPNTMSARETGELIGLFLKVILAADTSSPSPAAASNAPAQNTCAQRIASGLYACQTVGDYSNCGMSGCPYYWDCWRSYRTIRANGSPKIHKRTQKRSYGKCSKPGYGATAYDPDFVCDPETGKRADDYDRLVTKVCR